MSLAGIKRDLPPLASLSPSSGIKLDLQDPPCPWQESLTSLLAAGPPPDPYLKTIRPSPTLCPCCSVSLQGPRPLGSPWLWPSLFLTPSPSSAPESCSPCALELMVQLQQNPLRPRPLLQMVLSPPALMETLPFGVMLTASCPTDFPQPSCLMAWR